MTKIRCFTGEKIKLGSIISVSGGSAHHLKNVLRKKEGSLIELFDGKGFSAVSEIVSLKKSEVNLEVIEKESFTKKRGITINLGISLIKQEAFNLSIQKATELGVDNITPLFSDRSLIQSSEGISKLKKNKWNLIAEGACTQCGENWKPLINSPQELIGWAENESSEVKLVMFPGANKKISQIKFSTSVSLAVGPEGDFTRNEIDAFEGLNFIPVSLGQRILRTETAVISSLSAIRTLCDEF